MNKQVRLRVPPPRNNRNEETLLKRAEITKTPAWIITPGFLFCYLNLAAPVTGQHRPRFMIGAEVVDTLDRHQFGKARSCAIDT